MVNLGFQPLECGMFKQGCCLKSTCRVGEVLEISSAEVRLLWRVCELQPRQEPPLCLLRDLERFLVPSSLCFAL